MSTVARVMGFALINLLTFALDLGLLWLLHGVLGLWLPLCITLAYITAFGLGFVLNRVCNFRSHGALGRQLRIYLVVVAVNYMALILGVGGGLTLLGVDYRIARVAAGACEAVFLYLAMRWVVFSDSPGAPAEERRH